MRLLNLLSQPVTTILWRLPVLVLVRLPKRLLSMVTSPENRMVVFVVVILSTLVLIAKRLVQKAVERRN